MTYEDIENPYYLHYNVKNRLFLSSQILINAYERDVSVLYFFLCILNTKPLELKMLYILGIYNLHHRPWAGGINEVDCVKSLMVVYESKINIFVEMRYFLMFYVK